MLRMSLVLCCTLDCFHNGRTLINSHYVRWVNVINSNVVVSWYPKDILRQFERRGERVFWVKWYSYKNQGIFLARKPFLRTKEKHQQIWAIFSNLQTGSCVQKFWGFFKTVLAGLRKVFTSPYKLHLTTPGHWMQILLILTTRIIK